MPRGTNPVEIPCVDFENMPLMLNEKQAAAVCGVSVAYLRLSRCEGARKGRTPGPEFVRVNSSIRYPKDGITRWVKGLERRTAI